NDTRDVGKDSEYQPAGRVLLHSELRADDDSRRRRAHREHFFVGWQKSTSERSGLFGLEVGTEWAELLRRRRTARAQHSRLGGLPRFCRYCTQSARRKRLEEDAQA